ncbi:MAG TPA: outer membrane beta-barrel protein [Terriglobales bacterium]|nr:outer membrane beta-barrel protein [Terriglobales bacterium]
MRRWNVFAALLFLLVAALPAVSQQDFVSRYDGFIGYSHLYSPNLSLQQNGFHTQFGVNVRTWAALGLDFSYFKGSSTLHTTDLNSTQLAKLAPILPLLPPGFVLAAPFDATTFTFTGGPQFSYRRFKSVTLFIHPSIGGMHESVTAKPNNPILTQIVQGLIGPSMKKDDTEVFYGVGGGFDLNLSRHFAVRTQMDFVRVNLFSDILKSAQNNIRVSIGPTFRFGRNIVQ